jgi:hypothetical protein
MTRKDAPTNVTEREPVHNGTADWSAKGYVDRVWMEGVVFGRGCNGSGPFRRLHVLERAFAIMSPAEARTLAIDLLTAAEGAEGCAQCELDVDEEEGSAQIDRVGVPFDPTRLTVALPFYR